jgi:hypothetical protein
MQDALDATVKMGALFEAKVPLPLTTFAYAVPPHKFAHYYQMLKGLALFSYEMFSNLIRACYSKYSKEYFRVPDDADIQVIVELCREIHSVDSIFGPLDGMHTPSKSYQKKWQLLFKT